MPPGQRPVPSAYETQLDITKLQSETCSESRILPHSASYKSQLQSVPLRSTTSRSTTLRSITQSQIPLHSASPQTQVNSIIVELANIKSQSLLFNPHCDEISNSNSNFNSNSILLQRRLQLRLPSSSPSIIQVFEHILLMLVLRSFTSLVELEPPPLPEPPAIKRLRSFHFTLPLWRDQ